MSLFVRPTPRIPLGSQCQPLGVGLSAALLLVGLLLLSAGCGEEQPPPPNQPPAPEAHREGAPPLTPAVEARRVIAYAPSLVEFLFAMNEQGRLVGCSDYCNYPPAAKQIPVLGNAIQPDLEKIVSAQPDLVLAVGQSQKLQDLAAGRHFRMAPLKIESLADVLAAPDRIAELLGRPAAGRALRAQMTAEIDGLRQSCAGATSRPRVLVMTGDGGDRFTIGRGSFLCDIVTLAGGDCVTQDLAQPWPSIDLERLLASNPDVILMLRATDDLTAAEREALIRYWDAYPDFPAVKNKRIVVLNGSHLLLGGPRITRTAREFAQAIHPELFPAKAP